jgi:hypothetical protein
VRQILRRSVCGPLVAVLSIAFGLPPQAALGQAPEAMAVPAPAPVEEIHSKYSEQKYAELKQLIDTTELKDMDTAFFKKAYSFDHAPDMMKLIFSDLKLGLKSNRLAELRKFYDWSIQGQFARDHFVVIENTNQGKANGARSDLDATVSIVTQDANGKWGFTGEVEKLIEYQKQQYAKDGLKPEGVDVSLFNGENFFADVRDSRLGLHEFTDSLIQTVELLRSQKGAYFVPGANKEQTHDRALAEGHTVHIGWDHVAESPSVNGRPIRFDQETGEVKWLKKNKDGKYEFGGPVEELITKEAAIREAVARYTGVEALPPGERWRRALGNIVQNMKEFFEPHDAVGRNKYFIERVIDQGVGRFTHLDPAAYDVIDGVPENLSEEVRPPTTYVQIHGGDSPLKDGWKKAYIQQSFGLADGDRRIWDIQKVLDRSADIQLDKTQKRASYAENAKFSAGNKYYYQDEWADAVKNVDQKLAESGESKSGDALTALRETEAERLFVEKQARIIPEAAVQVVAESFRRDLAPSSNAAFLNPEVRKKLMVERSVEISLLLDIVESSPLPDDVRTALRKRVMDAVPKEVQDIVTEIADLAGFEMELTGRKGIGFEEHTGTGTASERWTKVIEKLNAMYPRPLTSIEAAKKALREAIVRRLLPVEAEQFAKAWESGKAALADKFGGTAYWEEMASQFDKIMITGAAISMIQTYQQTCADQTNSSEACKTAMAKETAMQILYMLPRINSGAMITTGLKQVLTGDYEGAVGVGLGVFSIPQVAAYAGVSAGTLVHVYIMYQMVKGAYAVTIGYAEQRFKNDFLDQAFKAVREPGMPAGTPAKLFPSPTRSSLAPGLVPDFPLLSDVIGGDMVPADRMTEAQRAQAALQESAPAIESELKGLGLTPGSAQWQSKQNELANRYGMLLPYLQRTANIHKVFAPKVAARGAETSDLMPHCLADANQKIQQKYAEPSGMIDKLRYLWSGDENKTRENDRQTELAAAWNDCVTKALEQDSKLLAPVFGEYLQTWLYAQSNYIISPVGKSAPSVTIVSPNAASSPDQRPNPSLNQPQLSSAGATRETTAPADIPLAASECDAFIRQLRAAFSAGDRTGATSIAASAAQKQCPIGIPSQNVDDLRNALMREYVVHRYMDQEESDRQMKSAVASAQQQSKIKLDLMAKDLDRRKDLTTQLGDRLSQPNSNAAAGDRTKGFTLRAPPYAIHAGESALFDVSSQVLANADATASDKTAWKVDLDSKVTKVTLGAPDNIIVTPELRHQLTPPAGTNPKRLVTFEETVTAQLKNASGAAVSRAQTTVNLYAVMDWQGAVDVEVRSAGPDTKDATNPKQTSLYAFAPVKLTGTVQAQKESAGLDLPNAGEAYFTPLPAGKYTIHVEPRAMDKTHKPVEAVVDLVGMSVGRTDAGDPAIIVGDEMKSITIVLPYVAPAQTQAPPKPPAPRSPSPPAVNSQLASVGPSGDTGAPPDMQLAAECAALTQRAEAALSSGAITDAKAIAGSVTQKKCGNSALLNADINKAKERADEIQKLQAALQQQIGACDYTAAVTSLQEIAGLDPANAALVDLPRMERLAAAQANLRNLLSDAAHPSSDAEARDVLGQLRQAQPDAPPCMGGDVAAAIASLERRLAALDRIMAALAACDYIKALAAAQQLQALAPDDDWLAANLGQIQRAAAAQSNALALIGRAQSAPAGPESAALEGQLRQSLTAAPACMASQIQSAIDGLPRGQKPSFLDATSQPGAQTSIGDNLDRARQILQQTTQDEADRQAREAEKQRIQAEQQRLQDQRDLLARVQAEQRRKAEEEAAQKQKAEENAAKRREAAQRAQQALSNILTALNGAQPPAGIGNGGPAAADLFEGTWSCHGAITSERNIQAQTGNSTSVIRISRDGGGYVMDSRNGPIRNTLLSGNHITFSIRVGNTTRWAANTTELSVTGNRMTGTEQMTNSDGALVTTSDDCTRQ